MSKKPNLIKPRDNGVEVLLDPNFLLRHALYMPDGETISKSNMTLGQAIEAIAFAHIKAKPPHLAERCRQRQDRVRGWQVHRSFADSLETLTF